MKYGKLKSKIMSVLLSAAMMFGCLSPAAAQNVMAEELETREWTSAEIGNHASEYKDGIMEGKSGFVGDLYVNASAGKLNLNGNGWHQFNTGTEIYVPVSGPSEVEVVGYDTNYTVGGMAASNKNFKTKCIDTVGLPEGVEGGSEKYIVIAATGNSYIDSIKVTYRPDLEGVVLVPHEVTVVANNEDYGTVCTIEPQKAGTVIKLDCEPAEGYELKEWKVVKGAVDKIEFWSFNMPDEDVEIQAVFEEKQEIDPNAARTWDLLELQKKNPKVYKITVQNKKQYIDDMYVDATGAGAKFDMSGGSEWSQFNKNTKLYLPAVRGCTVSVKAYDDKFAVCGTQAAAATDDAIYCAKDKLVELEDGKKYIVIEATGEKNYLSKITVTPDEEVIISGDARKIDVWDFGYKAEDTAVYENHITAETIAALKEAGNIDDNGNCIKTDALVFDDLKIYPNTSLSSGKTNDSIDNAAYMDKEYDDGYVSGKAFYCNGTGGASRRYMTLSSIQAGDKIVIYASMYDKTSSYTFTGMSQKDTIEVKNGVYKKIEFVAENTGTYSIYEAGVGKQIIHRIERIPGVNVSGSVDLNGAEISGYDLRFVNMTNNKSQDIKAAADNTFSATLAPAAKYKAILKGVKGYALDMSSREFTVDKTAGTNNGKVDGISFKIVTQPSYTFAGKIAGFAEDYDMSKLKITMVPDDEDAEAVELDIDEENNFSAQLIPEVAYSMLMEGVNDYEIVDSAVVESDTTEEINKDISVKLREKYEVTGGFINKSDVADLTFTNLDDKYAYQAEVSGGKYSIKLRNGAYEASSKTGKTFTHVVVDNGAVSRDIYFEKAAEGALELVKDLYVGFEDKTANNYATVNAAVNAAARMNPTSEAQRITIHIAPGVYREQIVVKTPYISFVNESSDEALITWYYGVGYTYYSTDSKGFYNDANAYDKFDKKPVGQWGCSVYVDTTAKAFRASGITFENSFNRYMTEEELADGVTADPSSYSDTKITLERNAGTDVRSKNATERGAAVVIKADKTEFKNCRFLSSQDTLFTGNVTCDAYFKNCFIEGQTDYIYGDGNVVFDNCNLSFKGYTTGSTAGYITAAKPSGSTKGYLFRNCVVTKGSEKNTVVTPGYFGRPWDQAARVLFYNTMLEDSGLIVKEGWTNMSGATAAAANFKEYGTTDFAGTKVDLSGRVANTILSDEAAANVKMSDYLGSWVPSFYSEKASKELKVEGPVSLSDNGDLNTPYPGHTITVIYSLGEYDDEDISSIKWYRVKDGEETLVKTSIASASKSYKIAKADIGAYIKVVITPKTTSGMTAAAVSQQVEKPVLEGYEDPEMTGFDPALGDGVNVFLVGDSTVRDYSDKCVWSSTARNEGSWGEFLSSFFNEQVTVVNYANGGRSTRNYINEGSLNKVSALMDEGDYLLIQFGHNDCAYQDAYKADRYVPIGTPDANGIYPVTPGEKGADGKYTWDCGGTYKWFLKQYVEAAKEKGATPILVTPVSRMYYDKSGTGKIRTHHDDNTSSNDAYVTAVKQLAKEEGLLCIDAFEMTKNMYEEAYAACGSDKYGFQVMSSNTDTTHNNKLGGLIEAALMASAIKDLDINISKAIKSPAGLSAKTVENQTVFVINNAGKLTAYDMSTDYNAEAEYWTATGQKHLDKLNSQSEGDEESGKNDETDDDKKDDETGSGDQNGDETGSGDQNDDETGADDQKKDDTSADDQKKDDTSADDQKKDDSSSSSTGHKDSSSSSTEQKESSSSSSTSAVVPTQEELAAIVYKETAAQVAIQTAAKSEAAAQKAGTKSAPVLVPVKQAAADTVVVTESYVNGKVKARIIAPLPGVTTNAVTVNAGTKYQLSGGEKGSYSITDGSQYAKVSKSGVVSVKAIKGQAAYSFTVNYNDKDGKDYIITFNVQNIGFAKSLKKTVLNSSAEKPESITISLTDVVSGTNTTSIISGEWSVKVQKDCAAYEISPDGRSITITAKPDSKGSVKINCVVNGKKYSTQIKVAK